MKTISILTVALALSGALALAEDTRYEPMESPNTTGEDLQNNTGASVTNPSTTQQPNAQRAPSGTANRASTGGYQEPNADADALKYQQEQNRIEAQQQRHKQNE
jgi:hypothetical protein